MKPTPLTDEEITYWVGSNTTKKALARAIEAAVNAKWEALQAKPVEQYDTPPNHLCKGNWVHLPHGEQCDKCGGTV
jgi:hypothetical protein